MKNNGYSAVIEVAQNAPKVFESIITVPKWWSKDFQGNSARLNDEFIIHHPGQHYSKQKLIEVVPDRKIVWLVTESNLDWIRSDRQEWTNTKMVFDITTAGDKTILHFTHEGLVPEKECYATCERGWDIVIKDWLHHFITTGKSAEGMINAAEIRNRHLEYSAKMSSLSLDKLSSFTDDYMKERLSQAKPYTAAILRKGPAYQNADSFRIVWEHGRRNFLLQKEGLLPIVCPVNDGTDVAGVGLFTTDIEHTKLILEDDPAIKAGILTYEIHPSVSFPGSSLP
jgi:hypothetical protein